MVANATIAISQLVEAFFTADGARLNPIQIMIGPGHNWRKKTHHALYPDQFNDQCKNQIEKTGNKDTAACILQFL